MPLTDDMQKALQDLSDIEKQILIDELLVQLDKPDHEIDILWLEEVKKRQQSYRAGNAKTVSLREVMEKYHIR